MNIHINKEEHEYLKPFVYSEQQIGSKLYGTNTENSDTDILCIYKWDDEFDIRWGHMLNNHQFQYKDTDNNIDYIYTTYNQFIKNQQNGDSTINSDVMLFTKLISIDKAMQFCRTHRVIKAYLGFAKRDIKQYKQAPDKLIHAIRGLYMAQSLIKNEIPTLDGIRQSINNMKIFPERKLLLNYLINLEKQLREEFRILFDKDEIKLCYIPEMDGEYNRRKLFQKLLDSNNTREFKY